MYRFNCHLTDELGDRLAKFAERAGMSKVTVVTLALNAFLDQEELKQQLLARMSDPKVLGEMCKAMGVEMKPQNS